MRAEVDFKAGTKEVVRVAKSSCSKGDRTRGKDQVSSYQTAALYSEHFLIDTLRDLLREKATVEANLTFVHQDLEVQKIYVEEVAISEKEHERDMEVIKQRYLTKVGELEDTTRQVI